MTVQDDFVFRAIEQLLLLPGAWVLIGLIGIGIVLMPFSRIIKGRVGEWAVSGALRKRCGTNCIILNDVTLKTAGDDTTQIDHIVIAPSGVFVIETKFFKGHIYGRETDSKWVQKIYKHSYTFPNPFRQNFKHVSAVQALLASTPKALFHSVVVMLGECELRSNTKPRLLFTSRKSITAHINNDVATNDNVIDVEGVADVIQSARLARGLKTDVAHIASLRKKENR